MYLPFVIAALGKLRKAERYYQRHHEQHGPVFIQHLAKSRMLGSATTLTIFNRLLAKGEREIGDGTAADGVQPILPALFCRTSLLIIVINGVRPQRVRPLRRLGFARFTRCHFSVRRIQRLASMVLGQRLSYKPQQDVV
jgi:hypothetical protein